MTQNELNAEVSKATGESLTTIAARGFSLVRDDAADFDEEQLYDPQIVDWDFPDEERPSRAPATTSYANALATTAFA